MEEAMREIAARINALRLDLGLSVEDMAQATGRTPAEYAAQESGNKDLSFTFLFKCAERLHVDVVELVTGESPHLTGFSVVRAGTGASITRRAGFEYLHKGGYLKNRLCEPFLVTSPYVEAEQDAPIHLSYHEGQEFDYILSGRMRFAYEDKTVELDPGDSLIYDSGRCHGMIAIGGEPCVFLAIVVHPRGGEII